jgi:hypothetical protein
MQLLGDVMPHSSSFVCVCGSCKDSRVQSDPGDTVRVYAGAHIQEAHIQSAPLDPSGQADSGEVATGVVRCGLWCGVVWYDALSAYANQVCASVQAWHRLA